MTESSDDPRLNVILEEQPQVIWFAFGVDLGKYVAQVRAYDAKRDHKTLVFVIVNSVEEALRAANEWKVDVLVVQGPTCSICSSYRCRLQRVSQETRLADMVDLGLLR